MDTRTCCLEDEQNRTDSIPASSKKLNFKRATYFKNHSMELKHNKQSFKFSQCHLENEKKYLTGDDCVVVCQNNSL